MTLRTLYLGDTTLETAASYLAGVLSYHGIAFDYVPSSAKFDASLLGRGYGAVIISDYMSSQFAATDWEPLLSRVRGGLGLLMIGGWESFTGLGGDYHATPLAEILPVVMQGSDDRINSYAPCMIRPDAGHEIIRGLPFAAHAAAINGYNRWQAKPNTTTILSVERYTATFREGHFQLDPQAVDPLLVVSQEQAGRVACYAGDVAPHWAGGFVDWGDGRRVLHADGAEEIEVGNWYVDFFGNLVKWVANQK